MRETDIAYLDPDARLDYVWDWQAWLADGDTIASATVTGTGITVDTVSHDTTTVTAWLSGGTVGTAASALCHITTAQGRQDDRTLRLHITQR